MELNKLYHFVLKELRVPPNVIYLSGDRTDSVTAKYARAIFCRVAKKLGHKAVDIGDYLSREETTVNNDVRALRALDTRDDFLSRAIVEGYRDILTKTKKA